MLDLNPIDLQWLWTIWPTCTFAWMIGFLIVKTKPIIINKVDRIGGKYLHTKGIGMP